MRPWEKPNEHGELPGGVCCQRAAGERCFEHDPANYPDMQILPGAGGISPFEALAESDHRYHQEMKMKLQRYTVTTFKNKCVDGSFVLFEDVEELIDRLEAFEEGNKEYCANCSDLREERNEVEALQKDLSELKSLYAAACRRLKELGETQVPLK
jgi:hypothetical protein